MSDGENVPRHADERAMREAYAKCTREHASLPAWTDLPLEMREAFIRVFWAGRRFEAQDPDRLR
jgi:hypothetical protein